MPGCLLAAVPLIAGCGSSSPSTAQLAASATCASVYPSPNTHTASTTTQVSLRNVSPGSISTGTVKVSGATTGVHAGKWVADSDGLGASFYPSSPFAAGETVTVSVGAAVCGANGDTSTFVTVVRPGPLAASTAPAAAAPAATAQATTSYITLPGVKIPTLTVKVPGSFGGSYFFETPRGGKVPAGLAIVNGKGQPVWFDALPGGLQATDLRAQTYQGQPVLTWWQGGINSVGESSNGEWVIMNSRYQILKTFGAANGYGADAHEFILTNNGADAWVIAAQTIGQNLTAIGGSKNAAVIDGIVQEIDLATGNVLFEWHSLDHVPVTDSYFAHSASADYDYFHMNSVDPQSNGTLLVSARHTHGVYDIEENTGAVNWELGGKHSSFTMGPGANFALQHDARIQSPTTISIFDDEDAGPTGASAPATSPGAPARAIVLRLNFTTHTATLVRAFTHNGLIVPAQGNQQILADGNTVVGWGSAGVTSVFSPGGTLLFDASYSSPINSYRAYLLPWTGTPTTTPSVMATTADGQTHVYASWNGSTEYDHLEGTCRILGRRAGTGGQRRQDGLPDRDHVAVLATAGRGPRPQRRRAEHRHVVGDGPQSRHHAGNRADAVGVRTPSPSKTDEGRFRRGLSVRGQLHDRDRTAAQDPPSLGGLASCREDHRQHLQDLSPEERARRGTGGGLVRLSCGLEDTGELIADLEFALRSSN